LNDLDDKRKWSDPVYLKEKQNSKKDDDDEQEDLNTI
jgi:hypothetical protein